VASKQSPRVHERWAQLRFSVIGRLLAAPPPAGELRAEIEQLAAQEWRHPITGAPIRFSVSTIERWYYQSLRQPNDPVGALPQGAYQCGPADSDERPPCAKRCWLNTLRTKVGAFNFIAII
jgi:hypothetical protein